MHNVKPNENRIAYIDGERITNIDDLLSDEYVSKGGLNPKRIYVMSGKSHTPTEQEPWKDTWCDATDSLAVWTSNLKTTSTPPSKSAQFISDGDNSVVLQLPHKQVDGMIDSHGNPEYYADTQLKLPTADYGANTPGIVTREYTENIKLLASKLSTVYQFSKGKQRGYRESITSKDELPRINAAWDVGDYVLVKEDYSSDVGGDNATYPSTMYAVIPGYVAGISYYGSVDDSDEIPAGLTGVELQSINIDAIPIKEVAISGESLSLKHFANIPICSEVVNLVLSGSMVYQVKTSDLFVDTSEDAEETNELIIEQNDYPVSIDKTELRSLNPAFADNYGTYTDENVTFSGKTVTIHRLSGKTWNECGIDVGDNIIVIFDKYATTSTAGIQSSTLPLVAGESFNPITGAITDETALRAIENISAKAIYKYFKLTQSDLFSDYNTFRGEPGKDYFVAVRNYTVGEGDEKESHYTKYYFQITSSFPREWSNAIQITGRIFLATETSIGGFYNVNSSETDKGYVYLDDSGHLRLRDYALLRAGTLAYQLGEDVEEFGAGESLSIVQETLDESINDRIAFPSDTQIKTSSTPNVIHVTISLTDEEPSSDTDTGTRNIFIRNIDSRFGTAVYFHFNGTATKKTIINFVDCEKIRIDSNICGSTMGSSYSKGPIINVYRCGLYYDPQVMNYISTCERPYNTDFEVYDYDDDVFYTDYYPSWFTGMKDISLWYQAYEDTDPRLTVDNMTVNELDVALESEEIDYWTPAQPNDNHFSTALSSLTFASDGTIVKCGLLVANNSTNNVVSTGESIIIGKFSLPQGSGLTYPQGCLTRPLKVTGSFTSAYNTDSGWYVADTNFTALTQTYDRYADSGSSEIQGSIAFHEKISVVQASFDENVNNGGIDPWAPDKYHVFYGGIFC